jgi:hypothetical protein
MKQKHFPKLAWHFDLHTPGNVRVNHKPNPSEMARTLKAAGVEEVITFAKCHFGHAYYPTKVGTPHPRLKGDAFGSVLAACRKQGVGVFAYLSFGIDGEAGRAHPEWQQKFTPDQKVMKAFDFISVCPFTSYLDKLMLPQIEEVSTLYRPDGLWFDTMSALAPCYCESCLTTFRKETGKEIPTDDNDPLQATFGQWRHDRGVAMVERVAAFIHQVLPGGAVGFNQLGSLYYPEPMPRGVTELSLDPPTYGPQSLQFGLNAAFGGTTGIDCEVMPTIMNQGWGDWSIASELRLEQVAVSIWARGVRLIYGDRLHPEIRLAPTTKRALQFVGSLRQRVADAQATPDVVILHSPSVTCGDSFEEFARNPRGRMGRISGSHELCLDAGLNTTVAAECYLSEWLDKARLIVVPELTSISRETESKLHAHAEQGGRILIVGPIPTVNGRSLDWLGVRAGSKPWQDHIYLPAWPGMEKSPVLVRGDVHALTLQGAKKILCAIPAYDAQHGVRYGWGIGPASEKPSPHPIVAVAKVGRGEVWYLGTPLFSDYAQHANWQQIAWFRAMIARCKAPLRAWIENPHGNVELVLWENATSTWAILIQHRGDQLCGTQGASMPWMRVMGPSPSQDIVLNLECRGRRVARARSEKTSLRATERRGHLRIPVRLDSVWRVVRVDWK